MKLLKLQLTNLFGTFNYTIEFNQNERITILTAPNGYGKTVTLKIIYSLFNKKFDFFHKLPFKKIIFYFDNSGVLELSKSKDGIQFKLKEKNKKNKKNIKSANIKNSFSEIDIRKLHDFLPAYMQRIGSDKWIDVRDDEILSTEEIVECFGDEIPDSLKKDISLGINSIADSLEVYLIQEQRLIIRERKEQHRSLHRSKVITDAIEKHSSELKNLIGKITAEYAQKTQSLDSSFPKRLFENKINDKDLDNRLSALQDKQKRISEFGLLTLEENAFLNQPEIKEKDKKILSLYITDNEQKLSVFDSLVDKIDLFVKILNQRRFNFKQVEVNKDGFVFKMKNGETLEPTELSSGEQHEVVLLFELLFNVKENSLVLIDEPEISLHVVWQKEFLDDIKKIIKLQKIDIIIATHSPQIINENWDLTVSLDEQV